MFYVEQEVALRGHQHQFRYEHHQSNKTPQSNFADVLLMCSVFEKPTDHTTNVNNDSNHFQGRNTAQQSGGL